jgi:hypothetical protein
MSIVVALLFAFLVPLQSANRADCRDVAECRQLALEARSREEFELFHDLAWRAFQKGPKNDPELMTLVARAQSQSGRPHDALVMLGRLADMKVMTDAATSDDFRRVRELPGWPELQARIAAIDTPSATVLAPPASAAAPSPKAIAPATPKAAPRDEPEKTPSAAVVGEPGEALRFTTPPFTPGGLAYDAVSNRFIVGDRDSRKLSVVGERSHNVSNLASSDTAGFGAIAALAIDPREGDLWVVSSDDGSASVHKLQLISGRVFFTVQSPGGTAARFADVSVTPQSTVIALDDVGRRLFRVRPKSKELEVGRVLEVQNPASIAAPSDSIVYVAHPKGIARVDLASGSERAVRARNRIDLSGLTWIRPYRNGLVGVQRTEGDVFRIVRITLDAAGTSATALSVLDKDVAMAAPAAAAVAGDTLYYLSVPSAESTEKIVRRVKLR